MPKRSRRAGKARYVTVERFKIRQIAVNLVYCEEQLTMCPFPSADYCPTILSRNLAVVLRVPPLQPGDLTTILGQLKVAKPLKKSVVVVAAKGKGAAARKALKKA